MTPQSRRALLALSTAVLLMPYAAGCQGGHSTSPAPSQPTAQHTPSPARPVTTASSGPGTPPGIAANAWIDQSNIPLYSVYHWPGFASNARTLDNARFVFEEICGSTRPSDHGDPTARSTSVAARTGSGVTGEWQAEERITHWPGDSLRTSQTAEMLFQDLVAELKGCKQAPSGAAATLSTEQSTGITATITTAQGDNTTVTHEYLALSACGGAVAELSLTATTPPLTPWKAPSDADVLDSITTPVCSANQTN